MVSLTTRLDHPAICKTHFTGFMSWKNTVAWSRGRFESSGLLSLFRGTFHPDPSSVVIVIVLADVATRRQPHSVALVCAQGHRGVKGYE